MPTKSMAVKFLNPSATSLFQRYRPQVQRYIYRMVRSEADTEDLVQETFLRVSRALSRFRGQSRPSTWIYRIATNVCLDFFRHRAAGGGNALPIVNEIELEEGGQEAVNIAEAPALRPEALFETSEMGECIREYVDTLPDTFRAVLILHDLEGLRNPEVAAVLGWSVERVKITVHRSRLRLKDLLEQHCAFYHDDRDVLRCDRKLPGQRDH